MKIALPAFLFASLMLRADGLADMKATLSHLSAGAPLKGTFELKTWNRDGKGKEMEERSGQASAWVEDGPQGLRLAWGREVFQKLEAEAQAQQKNPDAKMPLTQAFKRLDPKEIAEQVNAAGRLLRELEEAKFLEEKSEPWQGQPARLLRFVFTKEKLKGKDAKRIKEFDGWAKVWVGPDGTPLAFQRSLTFKGSVFLISFHGSEEENGTFTRSGDRLWISRAETKTAGGGMGMEGQGLVVKTFKAQ